MSEMFADCTSLTGLDLTNFNTANVEYMYRMFGKSSHLTQLDLSSFDTSKVTDMAEMFRDCTRLQKIEVSNLWSTTSVTSSTNMFYNCTVLVGGNGTTYNSSYIDITYARVDNRPDSPGYFTYKAYTPAS